MFVLRMTMMTIRITDRILCLPELRRYSARWHTQRGQQRSRRRQVPLSVDPHVLARISAGQAQTLGTAQHITRTYRHTQTHTNAHTHSQIVSTYLIGERVFLCFGVCACVL